jgi:integrase
MTPLRLRYVQAWVDHEGRGYHYFRRPGYPRVRLPGLPGSNEFMDAYQAALDAPGIEIGAARCSKPGSVSSAIAAYYGSPEFAALAPGTRTKRRPILEKFRAQHGDKPIALLPQKFITLTLSRMQPHGQRNWLRALRGLMQFAISIEMRSDDPTQGIKLARIKSDGHHSWTGDEIAQYEAQHAIGTKARLALALGLYTAQRRGDVVKLGRQHIKDGVLTMKQEKTGAVVAVPIHPTMKAILDATPSEHLTLLTMASGKAYSGDHFNKQFRIWCGEAGLPRRCKFHGLRKAALTRLAEAGATVHQIAAISGHVTLREVERYTKAADREKLAREGMARLVAKENSAATSECQTGVEFDKSGS